MDAAFAAAAAAYDDYSTLGRELQSYPDLNHGVSGMSSWDNVGGFRRIAASLPAFFHEVIPNNLDHQRIFGCIGREILATPAGKTIGEGGRINPSGRGFRRGPLGDPAARRHEWRQRRGQGGIVIRRAPELEWDTLGSQIYPNECQRCEPRIQKRAPRWMF
jgi:hypothetical protein